MSTIEEKIQSIDCSLISRRIKRELQEINKKKMIKSYDNISINKIVDGSNKEYHINIKSDIDKRHYKFIIPLNYPFFPPRLKLNNKPYSHYIKFHSAEFNEMYYKYKGNKCFCCESVLCSNNWSPEITIDKIMEEVESFHNECREIADIVIVNVIKRKYLIDDINILEWLY
jgi:hypothetical protein